MNEILKGNLEYSSWIKEISQRFRKSQLKAATSVNREMLVFYWTLGRDISNMYNESEYGKAFYKTLSYDLQKELPDVKSFSITNLKYMKYFYEMYSIKNRQQAVDVSKDEIVVDACDQDIFRIPWGHHVQILSKCNGNIEKALFFVKKTYENNWSRAVLQNFLETGLFEREGKAVNNFEKMLPEIGSDLAKEITKDPYNFDFLTLREGYDEKELKDALMNNIQKFLLELGKGFAFVGREYRIEVGSTEQYFDMLFYNIEKHCYIVIEIKTRAFEPGDMGQLGTYIAAADGLLRGKDDNPTIGLLICKTKDNVLAQYATSAINVPVGISEYQINNLVPEEYVNSLPTIEEIERELK